MSPSQIFIDRPVATTLLMGAVLMAGIASYPRLPVAALPAIDYPTIEVRTFYPGASPAVMNSTVTAPLEQQLGLVSGVKRMSSRSAIGVSLIVLQFELSVALDIAEQDVQAAINASGGLLPSDLPAPPVYAKVNPADTPIVTLALTSKTLPLIELNRMAETVIVPRLSQAAGVGLVSI